MKKRYYIESLIAFILMLIVLMLMVKGSLNAQIPDSMIQSNYANEVLPGLDIPFQVNTDQANYRAAETKPDLTGAKIFVVDEAMLVEMMKQDEKIAMIMTAAVIKAIGNDIKLCELIKWDLNKAAKESDLEESSTYEFIDVEEPKCCKGGHASNKVHANKEAKKCTCNCQCCKNSRS